MANLYDLNYEGVIFPPPHHFEPEEIAASKQLTQEELLWVFIDRTGGFDCSHPDYESPPQELLDRAGPLVQLFEKYGEGLVGS